MSALVLTIHGASVSSMRCDTPGAEALPLLLAPLPLPFAPAAATAGTIAGAFALSLLLPTRGLARSGLLASASILRGALGELLAGFSAASRGALGAKLGLGLLD